MDKKELQKKVGEALSGRAMRMVAGVVRGLFFLAPIIPGPLDDLILTVLGAVLAALIEIGEDLKESSGDVEPVKEKVLAALSAKGQEVNRSTLAGLLGPQDTGLA